MRTDAINANNMNVGIGGKQAYSHDSVIEQHDGFLGRHHYPDHDCKQLCVGEISKFIFDESDVGPFWLTSEEREGLYSKEGPKDDSGKVMDESFSLKKILAACTDFVEEKTLLQTIGANIGRDRGISVTIDRTPKCHPEVAGEGIEYCWAMSKIYL
mmetsp:Transcript_25228/g.45664  ORF Transcript_25228/g.45664 Transcript_25228/m.45664 type:complete len:156 (-) Transcript_25228:579-1046(-)